MHDGGSFLPPGKIPCRKIHNIVTQKNINSYVLLLFLITALTRLAFTLNSH